MRSPFEFLELRLLWERMLYSEKIGWFQMLWGFE